MAMRLGILIIGVSCVLSQSLFAEQDRHDGNYWLRLAPDSRPMYLSGFYEGLILGKHFTYWGVLETTLGKTTACASVGIKAFDSMTSRYLSQVTVGQLEDGLNAFYEDFRNRSILIYKAIWLVLNSISGKPETEMNKMIENFRKYANED